MNAPDSNMNAPAVPLSPMLLFELSSEQFISLVEVYNELLVRVHGNNRGAEYDVNCIAYIRQMPGLMRAAHLQALYYVYIMTRNSEFRDNFDANTSAFYFTVALSVTLKEQYPGTVTTDQLVQIASVPRIMLRTARRQVRPLLRNFVRPDDLTLSNFVAQMVSEIFREASNPSWEGHSRIISLRNLLLSFAQPDESASQPSVASASGPIQ